MSNKKKYNVLENRRKWLEGLLIIRKGNIGLHLQREFLFLYYVTIKSIYPEASRERFLRMLNRINSKMNMPLSEEILNSVMDKVDGSKQEYKFTNKVLIEKLEITQSEIIELGIGSNMRKVEERAIRVEQKKMIKNNVLLDFWQGYTIQDLQEKYNQYSERTIKRWTREAKQQSKEARNQLIIALYQSGKKLVDISEVVGCSLSTVKRVIGEFLKGSKRSDFNKTERLGSKSETTSVPVIGFDESLYSTVKLIIGSSKKADFDKALLALQSTKENAYVFGPAGAGKTHLINAFLNSLSKEEKAHTLLVAPTGLAAQHIGAQTIHKVFRLEIGVLEDIEIQTVPKSLIQCNRIIMDEVSLCRIDIFTRIIKMIQYVEKTYQKKIQIILTGDFSQLEPVATESDKQLLKEIFPNAKGIYAFHSELWDQLKLKKIMLTYIFRQDDIEFQENLLALKYGDASVLDWFNNYKHIKGPDETAIHICTRNKDVDRINQSKTEQFEDEQIHIFKAIEDNVTSNDVLPCPRTLKLAIGMRVMTIANDRYYKNGSLGEVVEVSNDEIKVLLDKSNKVVTVKRKTFHLESGGMYSQLPIVLGYALSVHKCQGMEFDSIIVENAGFFAPGMLYTCISRVRSIEGLYLMQKLSSQDLIIEPQALEMTIA